MLLDKYLPRYDFTEVHTIKVKASPETAYRAVMDTTLGEINGLVNFLFYLRALPEKLAGREEGFTGLAAGKSLIGQMTENSFVKIEETPRELVFGMIIPGSIGRVWKKSSELKDYLLSPEEFLAFNKPEFLHVIANLMVQETETPGVVTVYTESRTMGLSEKARKSFRLYWALIRPWSGLIRRLWLKAIKRRAEKQQV